MLDRRRFLGAGAGAALASLPLSTPSSATPPLAAPALARGTKVLRFVPQANLANFDPIWGTQYVVRNAAALVWDTLYGIDDQLKPRRQMVEAEEVSPDGLTWTFRLRAGLKFHDREPVLARDVVASLARWSARDPMGLMIRAIQLELVAIDDRTIRWRLSKPFPKMLLALGKTNTPMAFIMPERIARTDPFTQISEYVGSGPMSFARDEWLPGARAVFERFAGYVPRDEPASWLAGGKRILLDRIEWVVLPDPATAAAALQNGEVDWWETPIPDLVQLLKQNGAINVAIADTLGNVGSFRMNHLHPPFDNVKVREAVMTAVSQADYMRAVVGDDALWKPMAGFFTPGTPLYSEAGGATVGKGDLAGGRAMLRASGYNGEPVTCVVAQDQPIAKNQGDVTADLLKRMGFNVDFVATDWGTTATRRASKADPRRGGWNMFHTWHIGVDCTNPATYSAIRANGDKAWFGWPTVPPVEAGVGDWFDATDLAGEKAAAATVNAAACDGVVFVPTGFFLGYQAWRRTVSGVTKGPLPFAWGVSKA